MVDGRNVYRLQIDRLKNPFTPLKEALRDPEFRRSYTKAFDVYTSFAATRTSWDGLSVTMHQYVPGEFVLTIVDGEGNTGVLPVPPYLELL